MRLTVSEFSEKTIPFFYGFRPGLQEMSRALMLDAENPCDWWV